MSSITYTDIIDKNSILKILQKVLTSPEYDGQGLVDLSHVNTLLDSLSTDIMFVIEYPYTDRHYRDTYYSFYASKFRKTGRDCIRVHIFKKGKELDKNYAGFFIIRPLPNAALGRSLISPEIFKENTLTCCLTRARVSIRGVKLTVHGFPHIAQDEETHTCAESALWSFTEYFGSKYRQYKPLLPSQIIKTLLDNSDHRLLPSRGLSEVELAKCLQYNGFQCIRYNIETSPEDNPIFQFLRIYIESGMPLLLTLGSKQDKDKPDRKKEGHAVLVIGHEETDSMYNVSEIFFDKKNWVDVSSFTKRVVLIDDNMPPYKIVDLENPTKEYKEKDKKNMTVKSFLAPFAENIYLPAEKVYTLLESIFNADLPYSLKVLGGKWITRLLLTGGPSFRDFILTEKRPKKEKGLCGVYLDSLLNLKLPRFIWICELYKHNNSEFIKGGYCSGLLIVDATGDGKSLSSVLWYAVDDKFVYEDDFFHETDKQKKKFPFFKMSTYRNNLKGGWSEWAS